MAATALTVDRPMNLSWSFAIRHDAMWRRQKRTSMKTLKTLDFDPSPPDACVRFAMARVMSPQEVGAATRGRQEAVALSERWMVCGEITRAFYASWLVHGERSLTMRMSAFTSTEGGRYAVLTHQLREHQHRFVLPMWSTQVQAFLSAVAKNPRHGFMFACESLEFAVVLRSEQARESFVQLAQLCPMGETVRDAWRAELPLVLSTVGRLTAIPSLDSEFAVTDLSVSVAVPRLANAAASVH